MGGPRSEANFGSQHDDVISTVVPLVVALVPDVEEGAPYVAVSQWLTETGAGCLHRQQLLWRRAMRRVM